MDSQRLTLARQAEHYQVQRYDFAIAAGRLQLKLFNVQEFLTHVQVASNSLTCSRPPATDSETRCDLTSPQQDGAQHPPLDTLAAQRALELLLGDMTFIDQDVAESAGHLVSS